MPERPETPAPAAPRYAFALAMLACALAALTLAYPALSGGFLVNPHSDQYIAGFAFRDFAAQSLHQQGQFPQWNPYLFGGMPYVGAMHGDIFYPTFLLRMVLPTDVAMTWGMILHFWLAGITAFAFLRAHRLSFRASLIGGFAYMMSGQIAGLVSPGHDGKLFISALFPLTLLVLRFGVRGGKRWAWGALALVVGLAILTPHPQLFQYLLIASGAYALWLAFGEGGEGAPTRQQALRRLGLALGAVVVGTTIGAIQFLPLRSYTAWSPRAGGHDWATAVSYSMPPEELINWFLPQFSGILDNYWGRNGIHFHSEYLGLPVLLLAGAGLFGGDPARKRWRWFLAGLLVISVLWALGGYTPFYHLVAALVPGTKYFRAPSTIMFESAFAIAALAALGAENLFAGRVGRRFVVGGWIAVGVLTLLGVTGAFGDAFGWLAIVPERFDANQTNVTIGAWRMFIFGAGTMALIGAVAFRKLDPKLAGWALAVIVVADLWSVERDYWLFSARASVLYASDAAVAKIQADSQLGRTVTLQASGAGDPRDAFLRGDALMSNGVRLLKGYHGNSLSRYDNVVGADDRELANRLVNSPAFAALTNLHWVYANVGDLATQVPSKFSRVLGPVKDAVGNDVWLYRVAGDNPYAWVVPTVMKVPDDVALSNLYTTAFPVRGVALFDTAAKVAGENPQTAPQPLAISARVTKWSPSAVDIALDAPAPAKSALIVSENFYPGWTATVDGKPAEVDRADYTIIGVPLAAGARSVQLRFDDPAYERGKVVTLIALIVAVVTALAGIGLDMRRSRA